jgi:hypothetical protein
MAPTALTKTIVEGAAPGDKWGRFLWDGRTPGFGVRVFPPARPGGSCRRVYVFRYRSKRGGKQRLVTLGQHGPLTVQKARDMAAELYESVRRGRDPVADGERATLETERVAAEASYTFDAMVNEWAAERLVKRRCRYAAEAVRAIRHGLTGLLAQSATQITRDEAARALRQIIRAGHPVTAVRTMAYHGPVFRGLRHRTRFQPTPSPGCQSTPVSPSASAC